MGVQGLTTLLRSRAKHSQNVDLVAEAAKRRPSGRAARSNASTSAHVAPLTGGETHTSLLLRCFARDPTALFVLVDGLGVFHELTHVDAITARAIPAYDVLHARVTGLVESLRSAGVEIIAYFDTSSTETTKREEIFRRAEGRVSPASGTRQQQQGCEVVQAVAGLTSFTSADSCPVPPLCVFS